MCPKQIGVMAMGAEVLRTGAGNAFNHMASSDEPGAASRTYKANTIQNADIDKTQFVKY